MMNCTIPIWERKKPSFGFISTRLSGTDGVSLEAAKWVEVLRNKGCECCFLAGQLDTDPEWSHEVPKAFFKHPEIEAIQHELFVLCSLFPPLWRVLQSSI